MVPQAAPQLEKPRRPDMFPLNARHGFTLVELIVVISLLSIVLFFAVPRIDPTVFSEDSRTLSSWLLLNTRALKDRAVEEQTVYVLHVGLDENRIWTGRAGEDENGPVPAGENGFDLPAGTRITDVMFPKEIRISSGTARIHFYPRGYSDRAIIHVRTADQTRRSYRIESFLSQVAIRDTYIEF